MQRDGGADGDSLGGAEEGREDTDGGQDGVKGDERMGEKEESAENGAGEVRADQGGLEGPAIDKDAGQDAENGDGEEIGDLEAGDLLRVALEAEGEDADHGEKCEEIAKGGDDLGDPEPAHDGDAEDLAHAHGGGRGGSLAGGNCGRDRGCGAHDRGSPAA